MKKVLKTQSVSIKELFSKINSEELFFSEEFCETSKSNIDEIENKNHKTYFEKNPIQNLENQGHKVLKDKFERLIVGVERSHNPLEGTFKVSRKEPVTNFQYIQKEDIEDYNSLWEITKTGWDTEGEGILYPYICVDGKWYRWDENTFLRPKCKTYHWTEKNHQKFIKTLF